MTRRRRGNEVGAAYAGGIYYFGRVALGAPWHAVAAGIPGIWLFGGRTPG